MRSTPGAVSGPEDSYTDWAVDFQDDLTIPQFRGDVLSIRGLPISAKIQRWSRLPPLRPHRTR